MNKSQKILVIDSSTPYLYLALYDEEKAIDVIYQKGENDHSVTLMDNLAQLFDRNNMSPKMVDKIIVGIGPGSYTGLRIGVVVAKMLGWSLKVPVYTVSSLALLASSIESNNPILPWMDARRGFAFLGLYILENGQLKQVSKDEYAHLLNYQESISKDVTLVAEGKPNMLKLMGTDLVKKVEDIHHLAPVYLRETEAERNLNQSNE